jgi:hypothetical protein
VQINVSYDSSVAAAPPQFTTIVADVVEFFDSTFSNPITINIDVGWGEVDGLALSARSLGESITNFDNTYFSYDQVRAALIAKAVSPNAKEAVASLPASDPTGGGVYSIPTAEAKALGLSGASSQADGYVGFDASPGMFDFNVTSNTYSGSVQGGEFDLFGVIAHEFSEVMGRQMNFGVNHFGGPGDGSGYLPLDLFDFSGPGVRSFSPRTARYFSTDNGQTDLATFNSQLSGDKSDWDGSTADAFNAQSASSIVNPVSPADITLMNVLGYQTGPDFTVPTAALHGPNFTFTVAVSGAAAPASTTGIYVWPSTGSDPPSTLVASHSTPALKAGGETTQTVVLSLPATLAPGAYAIGAVANAGGGADISDTSSNVSPLTLLIVTGATLADEIGPTENHFDLAGTQVAGSDTVFGALTTSAALSGAGTLTLDGGALFIEPGASLTLSGVTMRNAALVEVDTSLTYAGAFQAGQGAVSVKAGQRFSLAGADDTIDTGVTGAGGLAFTGGQTTLGAGAGLKVASVSIAGAATVVDVAASLAYGGRFSQSSGTLSVAAGDVLTLEGLADRLTGTIAGAGRVSLGPGSSETLRGAVITGAGLVVNGASVTLSGVNWVDSALYATSSNLTVAAGGATLQGGGEFVLSNLASNRIEGATASAALNVMSGKIRGAGDIGGGQMSLYVGAGGTIQGNDGVALTIDTGASKIVNYGLIEATGSGGVTIAGAVANGGTLAALGGDLTVEGPVSGGGSVRIGAATADFEGAFSVNVTLGTTGVLELGQSQTYKGTITGFSHSGANSLDLDDIAFGEATTASFSGSTASGVLTVSDGTHTARIKLAGNYLKSSFNIASDGHGGATVVDPPKTPGQTQVLVAAMAGFAPAGAAGESCAQAPWRPRPPLLAPPHTATA